MFLVFAFLSHCVDKHASASNAAASVATIAPQRPHKCAMHARTALPRAREKQINIECNERRRDRRPAPS